MIGLRCAPLMKNCFPVLSKNLLPKVEIVGRALIPATKLKTKGIPANMLESIMSFLVGGLRGMSYGWRGREPEVLLRIKD